MKHHAFCRRCGADMALDEPIRIDDFFMIGDAYPLCYKGIELDLTNGERTIIWSIMKAFPACVRSETLLDRLDSTGTSNTIQATICRLRIKLEAAGAPDPIETVREHGYRWRPGGGHAIAAQVAEGDQPVIEILRGIYGGLPG